MTYPVVNKVGQRPEKFDILFVKIAHQWVPEVRKVQVRDMFRNKDSTFHSGPYFNCH